MTQFTAPSIPYDLAMGDVTDHDEEAIRALIAETYAAISSGRPGAAQLLRASRHRHRRLRPGRARPGPGIGRDGWRKASRTSATGGRRTRSACGCAGRSRGRRSSASVTVRRDGTEEVVPYWTTGVFGRDSDGWTWRYWGGSEPRPSLASERHEPMTTQLRVLVEQPTQGQALGRRRGGLAGSRAGRQDGGRGGREAGPIRAAIPSGREARRAGLGARDPDRPRDHRPVPGGRLDRLLGHLVRALAARSRAVRRADLRPPGAGCCAPRGPSSTRRPPASRPSSGRASGAAAAPATGSSGTSWRTRAATSRSA